MEMGGGGPNPVEWKPPFTSLADGRCLCGTCVPNTVQRIAESVAEIPRRRKILLFIGSGIELQTADDRNACNFHLRDARTAMLQALDRANLTVHSIDPAGLEPVGTPAIVGPARQPAGLEWLEYQRTGRRPPPTATDEFLASQNSLGVLPERTGGRTVVNTNAPPEHIPAIFEESQSYYVLGFVPADSDASGRVRSIEVRVNRRGVDVHARRQYVLRRAADTAGEQPALDTALTGLLPATGIPLELHVASFAIPGSTRAAVTISARVDAFAPVANAGAAAGHPLELAAAAYDAAGRPHGSARQRLGLQWPPASAGTPRRVEALSRLDLEPGDYEIRIAASDPDTARTASVFTQLTIPAYATEPLALSPIVFGAGPGTATAPPDFVNGLLPVAPTTQRTFGRTEQAAVFARIYQGTLRSEPTQPVQVRARIIDTQDRAVLDQTLDFPAQEFAATRDADCGLLLPITSLPAGEYLFSLEATMGARRAGRAVRFRVE
jgi:hypothetical protein